MESNILAFWLLLSLTVICATLVTHLSRAARERTIRDAVEKGIITDADSFQRLRGETGMKWPLKLIAFGLIFIFMGLGAAVLGLGLLMLEASMLAYALFLGFGAFVVILGVGLAVTGFCLRKLEDSETPR